MPFITEELYQGYFRQFEKIKSVHISNWPEPVGDFDFNQKEQAEFDKALSVINEIRAYKSSKQFSQAADLDLFETTTPLPATLVALVRSVCKVKEINQKTKI